MSLKKEMREAAAVEVEAQGAPQRAGAIRRGGTNWLGCKAVNAAIAVLDEYEEMEVQQACSDRHFWRCLGSEFWASHKPSFTIYRKKPKPEPGMRRAAKEAAALALCGDGRTMSAGAFEHDDENRMDTTIVADAICEYYEKQLAAAIAKEGARRKHGST